MLAVLSRSKRMAFMLSSILLAAEASLSAYLLYTNVNILLFNAFQIYSFSMLFASLFAFLLLLVNLLVYKYSKDYADQLLMLGFVFVGSVLVPATTSMLFMFISLELIALPTAFMMLLTGKHCMESTVKFFVMSAVAMQRSLSHSF